MKLTIPLRFVKQILRKIRNKVKKIICILKFFVQQKKISKRRHIILNKISMPDPNKVTLVFQITNFDKGGLEEVVLSLIKGIDNNKFNIYLFIVSNDIGYLGNQAVEHLGSSHIIVINHDLHLLESVIYMLKPSIVNTHYSDFGYKIYKQHGTKIIDTIHNNYIWISNERRDFDRNVDKFIAVSHQVKDFYVRKFNIPTAKIKVIPNGIDVSKIRIDPVTRDELKILANDFVFINVASFNYNKAHILIITALYQLAKTNNNIKLILVGNVLDQDCFDQVKSMIKDYKLEDKVIILNYVPKSRVYGLLSIADCFVFPSIIEGWSIAAMEAMYMNLPLIMSDIGSASDVVTDNDIGIIIDNPYVDPVKLTNCEVYKYRDATNFTNISSLVDAMNILICNNLKLNLNSNNVPRRIIEDKYNLSNFINMYQKIYQEVLDEK